MKLSKISVAVVTINIVSYIFGLINSFFFNKFWTFRSKKYKYEEFFWFIIVFFIAFGIQYCLSIFLKEELKFNPMFAYIIGNIFYTATGFIGNKLITFRKNERC